MRELIKMSWFAILFKGRINRRTYLFGALLWFIYLNGFIPLVYLSKFSHLNATVSLVLVYVWIAFLLIFSFSLQIRRLHDLGQSGLLSLLFLVPLVDLVMAFVLLL